MQMTSSYAFPFSPVDSNPIDRLVQCLHDKNIWMSHNFLQLNQDKTEILIFGGKARRETVVHMYSLALHTKHQVKNLGVILDPELNCESNIRRVVLPS